MQRGRCRDLVWGEKGHGCVRGEGALITETDMYTHEREREKRPQGIAQEKHFSKVID